MESADKKRKLEILFKHGESEEEIKQFRADRRNLREKLREVKKKRKAAISDSLNLLHGPHYETLHIDRFAAEERIKIRIVPETQKLIVTEEWTLKTCKYNKTGYDINLIIPSSTDKHLDWFFSALQRGKLSADTISVFPNVKEITESVAASNLLRHRIDLAEPALVLDVGAGSSPRTGSIIAQTYPNAIVHSIDPKMNARWVASHPWKNLSAHISLIEDWIDANVELIKSFSVIAVTAVHSHAPLENYIPKLRAITKSKFMVLAMQCCVPQVLSDELQIATGVHMIFRKTDLGIHSPHRTMCIWASDDGPSMQVTEHG